jgi:hypothetical protein
VQENAKNVGPGSASERLLPEQPGSDRQRDIPSKEDARLQQIERAGSEATDTNSENGGLSG